MRRNMKTDFVQSMDSLRFSAKAKEDMTNMLISEMNNKKQTRKHNARKLLLLSLAAATLLVTLTGAAVYTHWSRTAQHQYKPTQQIKEQAEKSGLSVMLEEPPKASESSDVLSATDQGITVTAVQTLIDGYQGQITFRIEGFDLPESKYPYVWPAITIDGDEHPFSSLSGSFFDGTTHNEEGQWVYADTGLPVEHANDEFQTVILKPVAKDGSMEYTSTFSFQEPPFSVDGKEIVVKFDSIGIQSDEPAGMPVELVKGNWELRWALSSSSEETSITPNAEIGASGVKLLDAQIGQKTIHTTYQLKEYFEGFDVLEPFPQALTGVRMKDGTEYRCYSSSEGYEDVDKLIFFVESSMYDAILDPSQVESLMFLEKGHTSDPSPTYIYIPIS